ncbi:MAG: TolC family protein [Campylobacterales bacterium]|nr:TolC family protein [Campylobacterales bacterium]
MNSLFYFLQSSDCFVVPPRNDRHCEQNDRHCEQSYRHCEQSYRHCEQSYRHCEQSEAISKVSFIRSLFYLIPLFFLLNGCNDAVGPQYEKPNTVEKLSSTQSFHSDANITMIEWWIDYDNKELNDLIRTAFKQNRDVSIVSKQLDLVLNAAEIAKIAFIPTGSLGDTIKADNTQTIHKLGVSLTQFEFDYLGKMKKTMEQNSAYITIAQENLALLHSTISFEIASSYSNILYYETKKQTTQMKLKLLEEMEIIYQKRFESGLDDISGLLDVQSKIVNENQIMNAAQTTQQEYMKTLKTIVGVEQEINLNTKIIPHAVPNQINSKQLEDRFDIKIAEQNLIDKNAKISIVKTLYYPSISIGAFGGIGGTDRDVFSSMSPAWALTPSIIWNVFDMPKVEKLVKESEIQKEQALDGYIKTVQNAFIEVKSNYEIYEKNKTNLEFSESYVKLLKSKLDVLEQKFTIGTINKVQLQEAQYNYLQARDMVNNNTNNLFQKEIMLKKSIGGRVKNSS